MNRHNTFVVKCLHLTVISTVVSARIVPNYYTSTATSSTKKSDDNNQLDLPQFPQTENRLKWSISDFNTQQSGDLAKLVKQSLENIFKNEDLSSGGATSGGFGLKTFPKEIKALEWSGQKKLEQDVDLSSPHVLKIPVPQPYPVHIPVKEPFTVPIYKLVPEEVEKRVPIQVEKLVPVYKEKPVKVIVEKHHPVPVYKPYVVPIPVNTHILLGNKKEQMKWYHNSF